jgi:predicted RNase H-like HicB family nuclease
MPIGTFTAVLHKEGDLYVADCPEVGTVSQGRTVEEAIANLKEATELYLEEFPPDGSSRPLVTVFEARYAWTAPRGQKRSALLNGWDSLRFGNVEVTLSLSASDRIEPAVASFQCIQNLQSAHCAES